MVRWHRVTYDDLLSYLIFTAGKKYCKFVKEEGGIPLLQDILVHPKPSEYVKSLAKIVLDNVAKWSAHNCQQTSSSKAEEEEMEA